MCLSLWLRCVLLVCVCDLLVVCESSCVCVWLSIYCLLFVSMCACVCTDMYCSCVWCGGVCVSVFVCSGLWLLVVFVIVLF